jgi:acetyl-CoA acyltransferase
VFEVNEAFAPVPLAWQAEIKAPKNLRYGLQTMCEGGGTANATLVELVA